MVRTVAQPEQAKPRPDDVPLMLEPGSPAATPEASDENASEAVQGATEAVQGATE